MTRLDGGCGTSVSGSEILLATENGDRIAVVSIDDGGSGTPRLVLHGYANIGNRVGGD